MGINCEDARENGRFGKGRVPRAYRSHLGLLGIRGGVGSLVYQSMFLHR